MLYNNADTAFIILVGEATADKLEVDLQPADMLYMYIYARDIN